MWAKQMTTQETEIDTRQVALPDVRKKLDNENNTTGAATTTASLCPRSNSSLLPKKCVSLLLLPLLFKFIIQLLFES
jgi:hypothetical protein